VIERREGDRLIFERSTGNRAAAAVLALLMLRLAVMPLLGHTVGRHGFERGAPWTLAILSLLLFGSISPGALLGSGPWRLTIDIPSRAYKLVAGFPLIARTWSGTLADFDCI
jgi:hypothetical protein